MRSRGRCCVTVGSKTCPRFLMSGASTVCGGKMLSIQSLCASSTSVAPSAPATSWSRTAGAFAIASSWPSGIARNPFESSRSVPMMNSPRGSRRPSSVSWNLTSTGAPLSGLNREPLRPTAILQSTGMASEVAQFDGLLSQVRAAQLPPGRDRRRIREDAGVSIREAAEAVGVAPMTFWRWETGEAQPTRANAMAYRRLLDALAEVSR
jgi:DNA-binding transcriptional regulator YiaG